MHVRLPIQVEYLVAAVEERVEEALGSPMRLTDAGPDIDARAFGTVGALADHIAREFVRRRS